MGHFSRTHTHTHALYLLHKLQIYHIDRRHTRSNHPGTNNLLFIHFQNTIKIVNREFIRLKLWFKSVKIKAMKIMKIKEEIKMKQYLLEDFIFSWSVNFNAISRRVWTPLVIASCNHPFVVVSLSFCVCVWFVFL